jgi:hypothetical protein
MSPQAEGRPINPGPEAGTDSAEAPESPHPKGALLLVLLYLVLLAAMWTNMYLKLWMPEGGRLP